MKPRDQTVSTNACILIPHPRDASYIIAISRSWSGVSELCQNAENSVSTTAVIHERITRRCTVSPLLAVGLQRDFTMERALDAQRRLLLSQPLAAPPDLGVGELVARSSQPLKSSIEIGSGSPWRSAAATSFVPLVPPITSARNSA